MISRKMKAFLAAYEECGCVVQAAEAVGIHRSQHYRAMENEPEYPALFRQAGDQWSDKLEGHARRLCVEGIQEPIYDKAGIQIGTRVKYPTHLIFSMLQAAKPERYRPAEKHEHSGPAGGAIEVKVSYV